MSIVTLSYGKTNEQVSKPDYISFDKRESQLIEAAHEMTAADIERIRQKDDITIEESQLLLLRMVEEEYMRS